MTDILPPLFKDRVFAGILGTLGSATAVTLNYSILGLLLLIVLATAAYIYLCKPGISALWLSLALLFSGLRIQVNGAEYLGWNLSAFYTLSIGFSILWLLDDMQNKRLSTLQSMVGIAVVAVLVYLFSGRIDYELLGLVLIVSLYFARSSRAAQGAVLTLWCFAFYRFMAVQLFYTSFLSVLIIMLYNGKKGGPSKAQSLIKWGFYLIYPAHLLVLGVTNLIT